MDVKMEDALMSRIYVLWYPKYLFLLNFFRKSCFERVTRSIKVVVHFSLGNTDRLAC